MIRQQDWMILVTIIIMVIMIAVLIGFIENSKTAYYTYEKVETENYINTNEVNSIFLNSIVTVKNDVLIVKSGMETRLVFELKENNQTGLNDWQYAYTKNGIKLVYQNRIIVYLIRR